MAIELKRPSLTREEFLALQDPDAGEVRGYEYEDGELIPVPPVHGPQSSAWGDLFARLYQHVERHGLGRVWIDLAVYLSPEGLKRYFPDIVYLASADLNRYDGEVIVGPPTLVVEVSAQNSRKRDAGPKKRAYHRAEVPWYWIADVVERQTEEYQWTPARYELISQTSLDGEFRPKLFPGLVLAGIRS